MSQATNCSASKKGVIYARANLHALESISEQISVCRKKMKENGIEEAHCPITEIAGGGISQKSTDMILKLLVSKSISYVYVEYYDRLQRNLLQLLEFLACMEKHGASVVSTI